jgi:hypothetical protein
MQPHLESSGGKMGKALASQWLTNFLEKSRESTVPIAPDICAADDTYLRMFSKQFAPTSSISASERITEPGVDDTGVDTIPDPDMSNDPFCENKFDNEDANYIVSDDSMRQVKSSGKIRLFNLPYAASEKEVGTSTIHVIILVPPLKPQLHH